jgi:hypothetical protein
MMKDAKPAPQPKSKDLGGSLTDVTDDFSHGVSVASCQIDIRMGIALFYFRPQILFLFQASFARFTRLC